MGLDMYLFRRTSISNYDWKQDKLNLRNTSKELAQTKEKNFYLVQKAIEWRKANAIHAYFQNCIGSKIENCVPCSIERDHLINLVRTIELVIENKSRASVLLPTLSGFFFGSTEYNDIYFNDLIYSLSELKKLLNQSNNEIDSFYYVAWW